MRKEIYKCELGCCVQYDNGEGYGGSHSLSKQDSFSHHFHTQIPQENISVVLKDMYEFITKKQATGISDWTVEMSKIYNRLLAVVRILPDNK